MAGGINIICNRCTDPMHPDAPACTDSTLAGIWLYFDSPEQGPHDYTLLHELNHRAGFIYPHLLRMSTIAQIEGMAYQVTAIAWGTGRSRDFTGSAAVGRRVWANKILNLSSAQSNI